jgi:hypothetical protein
MYEKVYKVYIINFIRINGGFTMDLREFLKKHEDNIVCEPSGRTYKEMKDDLRKRVIILER